jgi:hypothetical protein
MSRNSLTVTDDLVGPLYAEAFEKPEEVIKYFISNTGGNDAYTDTLVNTLVSGKRTVLSGVRGTGKTMVLKAAEAVLKERVEAGDTSLLPVYITYSGFKSDVSLQSELELNPDELKTAKEVFRGYFFMTLLYETLNAIEKLNLDKDVTFNWFGLRTKFGIKREVKKAISEFKRLGFKSVIESKQRGFDIGVRIKPFGTELDLGPNISSGSEVTEVTLDDLQKSALFKETVEAICEAYGIGKVYFLFDEVHYLKFLQAEFFDILFGFRNDKRISFSISAYPTFMDYGNNFDLPDDAKYTDVSSNLYKPTKKDFETPLFELIKTRILNYGKMDYEKVISPEAIEHIILLCNGNPRMILQAIEYIWRKNANRRITISSINKDLINEMVDEWYIGNMHKQAKRFKTNIGKAESFLGVITKRLRDYNQRNSVPTSFFLISEDVYKHYSDTIDLLLYSRIIDRLRISSFGGSKNSKGRMYLLNPMVAIYYGSFEQSQIARLSSLIKESLDKDKKIQFSSLKTFNNEIGDEFNLSCPRYQDGSCPDQKCGETYSEQWTMCPFHPGLSLELRTPLPSEVSISVINISERMRKRLESHGIKTLKDVIDAELEGLQKVEQVGPIRSKNIYYAVKEYIDDNL